MIMFHMNSTIRLYFPDTFIKEKNGVTHRSGHTQSHNKLDWFAYNESQCPIQ
uniref:Uncharacterized protein n=1 Tax=Podoviridae sp. ctz6O13 TaxID=2827757 RepID=A0A8S5TK92_9CAUD|nr:MAG TPA: hypothetical protein [Podoviridae sp. ctz6O13]